MENEGNTSDQHASQNVLGDFGSTENFNQQPLTDFSNIINQPPFEQVPEFMSIPPYILAQYRQEEQKMISAETPISLSKACEMFIQEMSLRAWMQTEENKRRVIQRHDVVESIHENKLYDFLTDVIPLQYQGGHPSLVPPPQPQLQEEHSGQAAENPNYAAPIVDESLMNMGINVTVKLGLSITPTRMERAMRVDFDDLEILDSTKKVELCSKKQRIFIEELSLREWIRTKEKNKNTIERNDFAEEINENKVYDFLADLVPLDPNDHPSSNVKEEHCGIITAEEVTNSDEEAPVMNVGNVMNPEKCIRYEEVEWSQASHRVMGIK
ncbi:putative CCAAT-binding transcription factor subunit aab-1 [Senna tora]|uniref:Putative CCAAT-binding transcription factor subunit aab-1 n=1 Tax=Senna tora TaxID=362788 RepID=A0A834THB0_9FABA|nr:putative CCAAT-binding transcription factor subunit aab-1 [Senna tora]